MTQTLSRLASVSRRAGNSSCVGPSRNCSSGGRSPDEELEAPDDVESPDVELEMGRRPPLLEDDVDDGEARELELDPELVDEDELLELDDEDELLDDDDELLLEEDDEDELLELDDEEDDELLEEDDEDELLVDDEVEEEDAVLLVIPDDDDVETVLAAEVDAPVSVLTSGAMTIASRTEPAVRSVEMPGGADASGREPLEEVGGWSFAPASSGRGLAGEEVALSCVGETEHDTTVSSTTARSTGRERMHPGT
ncbi:MAG: hypothetical protein AB2A00_41160 [Myxococcota bacterium]